MLAITCAVAAGCMLMPATDKLVIEAGSVKKLLEVVSASTQLNEVDKKTIRQHVEPGIRLRKRVERNMAQSELSGSTDYVSEFMTWPVRFQVKRYNRGSESFLKIEESSSSSWARTIYRLDDGVWILNSGRVSSFH